MMRFISQRFRIRADVDDLWQTVQPDTDRQTVMMLMIMIMIIVMVIVIKTKTILMIIIVMVVTKIILINHELQLSQ